MSYRVIDERFFRGGMIREELAYLLPPGALADCSNLIFDRPGIARQRNGSSALVSGAQTAYGTSLGFARSDDATLIEELYGLNGKTGALVLINKTTGATTALGTPGSTGVVGRPVRHFGFLVFPIASSPQVTHVAVSVAGQTSSTTFTAGAVSSMNANNPQITLSGADVTTNIKVGAVVASTFLDVNLAQWVYWGRVVSIDTTKLFTVWPTPTVTGTAPIGGLVTGPTHASGASTGAGGTCGASFQGRLLLGNTMDLSASTPVRNDRRVIYSLTPTETSGGNIGATFVDSGSWPRRNFFDVPVSDPIVAMEPVSNNELLILTQTGVVIFQGELATQTTTFAPGVTYDLSPLNTNAGCYSDLSVQRTPHGIVWASPEGIMVYRGGGRVDDLTEGKIHTYYRDLTKGSSFSIHGSFYAKNHYLLSLQSGGQNYALSYNLDSESWGPLTGTGTNLFFGAPRPTDPTQVYGLQWWDQSGSAPSFTNGQTVKVDTMFASDVVGQTKLDADGAIVAFTGKSRVLTDDSLTERQARRVATRYALEAAGANVTVAVGARLDTTDTSGTTAISVGSLSNTATLTISGQSNVTPIVITTTTNHGLQSEDQVDITGASPNTAANGRWRITVTSATQFSLNGSSGNGATSATGFAKKISEQEFVASAVHVGQGNHVQVASSGTVNRFEWHGVRVGALELSRGMSVV